MEQNDYIMNFQRGNFLCSFADLEITNGIEW